MIEARRELAIKNISDADAAKKLAYERLVEAEHKRLEAYDEAQKIIEKANRDSAIEYDKILNDARKNASDILEKAHGNARSMHRALETEANKRIVELTFLASEEILKRNIDKNTNEKLINEFIAGMKKNEKEVVSD
jgi:F-type H+-transporting ATPase subunit b